MSILRLCHCIFNTIGLFHSISTLLKTNAQVSVSVFHCISITTQAKAFFRASMSFVAVQQGPGARHILARVQVTCCWTRCVARAMSSLWSSVQKVPGGNTTVCTLKMQECPATLSQVEQEPKNLVYTIHNIHTVHTY